MKKCKTKNTKKKLAYGGTPMNTPTLDEEIFNIKKNTVDATIEAQNNPWARAIETMGNMAINYGISSMQSPLSQLGSNTPIAGFLSKHSGDITKGLGAINTFSNTFGLGGIANNIPIEAEGGELLETPNGSIKELRGPSHEQGGIDLIVPQDTEFFSKRVLGNNGLSMADRKRNREKKILKIQKLIEKEPNNLSLKKTLNKIKKDNEIEEQQDLQFMELLKSSMNNSIPKEKFLLGGISGPKKPIRATKATKTVPNTLSQDILNYVKNYKQPENSIIDTPIMAEKYPDADNSFISGVFKEPVQPPLKITKKALEYDPEEVVNGKQSSLQIQGDDETVKNGITFGDLIGIGGQLFSGLAPLYNNELNRKTDLPNINAFKNYGTDGLQTINNMEGTLDVLKNKALNSLWENRNATINNNRNSVRGVNTLRALDLATDSMINDKENAIYSQTAQQMMNILDNKAKLQNDRDRMVMTGDYQRDLADRQDKDNYFSNRAKDLSNLGYSLQNIGKNFNDVKERDFNTSVMNSMFHNYMFDPIKNKLVAKKDVNNYNSKDLVSLDEILDKISNKTDSKTPVTYDFNQFMEIWGNLPKEAQDALMNNHRSKKTEKSK